MKTPFELPAMIFAPVLISSTPLAYVPDIWVPALQSVWNWKETGVTSYANRFHVVVLSDRVNVP